MKLKEKIDETLEKIPASRHNEVSLLITRHGISSDLGEESVEECDAAQLRGYAVACMGSITVLQAAQRHESELVTMLAQNMMVALAVTEVLRLRICRDELVRRGLW